MARNRNLATMFGRHIYYEIEQLALSCTRTCRAFRASRQFAALAAPYGFGALSVPDLEDRVYYKRQLIAAPKRRSRVLKMPGERELPLRRFPW
jgi:hypothetical protein